MTKDTREMFERLVGILEHIVGELDRLKAQNEKIQKAGCGSKPSQ
jgi:hypothetical protein